MATDFNQYVNKFQEETLKAVKQAQDANVAAFQQARELFTEVASLDKMPTLENLPTPTKFVEMSFNFANQMLELRKQYALQVADLFTTVQKDATQATVRAAQAATNAVNAKVASN
jgi:hypothetical protein